MRSKPGPGAARIAYCGPIAQPGLPARGGYESANRRLIDDLRTRGLDVLEFAYPVASGSTAAKAVTYAGRFAAIVRDLLRERRRWDLLHITPLYGRFLYAEALLCGLAWSLGKRVVFDIRAGCFVSFYQERGRAYCALVDALLGRTDLLALEGKEDLVFAQARCSAPIMHLPNYVSRAPARPSAKRYDTPLRLVFLGRVVPEKGIEVAIGALECLLAKGLDARLDVIGGGEERYVATLRARTESLPVAWTGSLPQEEMRARMTDAHFFVFPTRHFGEGHSNALTEAMAEGLVPVCSEQGFNRSVVEDAGVILPVTASASDYAEAIASIWLSGRCPDLSAAAHERVKHHFTGDVVLSDLIRHYEAAKHSDRLTPHLHRS